MKIESTRLGPIGLLLFICFLLPQVVSAQCNNGHPVNPGGRCDHISFLIPSEKEGRTITGPIAEFSICNGWFVDNFKSEVDWGDKHKEPIDHSHPNLLVGTHTYEKPGPYDIKITTAISCNESFGDIPYPALSPDAIHITIYDTLPLKDFQINQTTVVGGTPVRGTVKLYGLAPASGSTVTLISDDPSVVTVPSQVVVPLDADIQNFTISTKPVSRRTTVKITASGGDRHQKQDKKLEVELTVTPRD